MLVVSLLRVLLDFLSGKAFPIYGPKRGIPLNRSLTSCRYFSVKTKKMTGSTIPIDQPNNLVARLRMGLVIREFSSTYIRKQNVLTLDTVIYHTVFCESIITHVENLCLIHSQKSIGIRKSQRSFQIHCKNQEASLPCQIDLINIGLKK